MVSIQKIFPKDIQTATDEKQDFALEVLHGLSGIPKTLPSKYFYDDKGTRLFQQITELPEYYLTRCESEIFERNKSTLAELMGNETFNLVELGAGDGRKTSILLEHFLEQGLKFEYVPIDISQLAVEILLSSVEQNFPRLHTAGLVAEYTCGIKWLRQTTHRKNLVLFIGSNIGNFSWQQARHFLQSLWNVLNPDDYVVIGFDLKKDIDLLVRAYNDSAGITRAFNLNLLERINRELGGNFNLRKFRHYEPYNVRNGAMESYLVSEERHMVFIKELSMYFTFETLEAIHVESSHKYSDSDIRHLAGQTGFVIESILYDLQKYFADAIWRVHKSD